MTQKEFECKETHSISEDIQKDGSNNYGNSCASRKIFFDLREVVLTFFQWKDICVAWDAQYLEWPFMDSRSLRKCNKE